jgi:hypothetical protein
MRKLLTVCFVSLVTAAPALAQDKPIDVNIGFGVTFPTSGFKDNFDTGWDGTIGLTFNLNQHLGFQSEYIYSRMSGPEKTIIVSPVPGGTGSAQLIESNQQMHIVPSTLQESSEQRGRRLRARQRRHLPPHDPVDLAGYRLRHSAIRSGYCYPAAVSVDNILGDRSSNDFGIDFGGGGPSATRRSSISRPVTTMWGPPSSRWGDHLLGAAARTPVLPLTFGVRW